MSARKVQAAWTRRVPWLFLLLCLTGLHPADETDNHTWLSIRPGGTVELRWLLRVRRTRAMGLRDRIDADGDMDYSKVEISRTAMEVARAAIPLLDLYVDGLPLKIKLLGARLWGDGKDGLYDVNNEILLEARFRASFPPGPGAHLLVYRDRNYPARILPGRMHKGNLEGLKVLKADWDAYPPFVGARIKFVLPKPRPASRPASMPASKPASRPVSRPASGSASRPASRLQPEHRPG